MNPGSLILIVSLVVSLPSFACQAGLDAELRQVAVERTRKAHWIGPADPKAGPSAEARLAGCYEVVSLSWSPHEGTIGLIPRRFRLLGETAPTGSGLFAMRSEPSNSRNLIQRLWAWRPRGRGLWVVWSTGFGGFRGTLKPSATGELAGKLKEFCDGRCGWKKRVGRIQIRRVDCKE